MRHLKCHQGMGAKEKLILVGTYRVGGSGSWNESSGM